MDRRQKPVIILGGSDGNIFDNVEKNMRFQTEADVRTVPKPVFPLSFCFFFIRLLFFSAAIYPALQLSFHGIFPNNLFLHIFFHDLLSCLLSSINLYNCNETENTQSKNFCLLTNNQLV